MDEFSDLIITIFGKYGRLLNIQGRRVCFIFWVVCATYWCFRHYGIMLKTGESLWVQTMSAFVSVLMYIFGYFNWKKKGIGK